MMADDFGGPLEDLSLERRAFKEGKNLIETIIYQMERWEGPFFVVKAREYEKLIYVTSVDILTLDMFNDKSAEVEVTTIVYRHATWFDRMMNRVARRDYIGDIDVAEKERHITNVVLDSDLIEKMREAYIKWESDEAKIRETVENRTKAQRRLDGARAINRMI